ncbi:Protein pellino, partial [Operophtera brumata]
IGRSSESPIDFVVMDTVAGDKTGDTKVLQSTISRFACRIISDRNEVNHCRIYAAGFDSSRNIFLGEKATKWTENHEIDGLTTNGVLIMHPRGDFCGGSATCGPWRETSCPVGLNTLVIPRKLSAAQQDLNQPYVYLNCGHLNAGWPQCPVGLNTLVIPRKLSAAQQDLNQPYVYLNCGHLNAGWPQCPVSLNTLVIPRKLSAAQQDLNQPYVYLNCGHVQIERGPAAVPRGPEHARDPAQAVRRAAGPQPALREHSWGADSSEEGMRRCPMCMTAGTVVRVCMGIEPAFYVDAAPPTYAFNPCGHMASERTVNEEGMRRCPMCMTAGTVVRVCMGIEPAFYVDAAPPTYAFNPCGHMASERTVNEEGMLRCPMCMTAGTVVRVCMDIEPALYVDAAPPTLSKRLITT